MLVPKMWPTSIQDLRLSPNHVLLKSLLCHNEANFRFAKVSFSLGKNMDERKKNNQGGQCFYHKITFDNEIRKTDIYQDNLQQIELYRS